MEPQRIDLYYEIVWNGRWHVGSGYQSAVADRLLRRMGGVKGDPFVPGSQIKGVLRYQCEQLALALGFKAINPHAVTKDDEQNLLDHFTPLANSELIVDRLFGSRYQGECLFVTNAMPISSDSENKDVVQTRTAMDRTTGTVMEQHLFTTELVERKINLRGQIRGRHPAGVLTQDNNGFPYEYSLLLSALPLVDALGGDKSVGLGRCDIKIGEESLYWNGCPISLNNVLQGFHEVIKEFESEDLNEWINSLREESRNKHHEKNPSNRKITYTDSDQTRSAI